jgi:hypothetical protein
MNLKLFLMLAVLWSAFFINDSYAEELTDIYEFYFFGFPLPAYDHNNPNKVIYSLLGIDYSLIDRVYVTWEANFSDIFEMWDAYSALQSYTYEDGPISSITGEYLYRWEVQSCTPLDGEWYDIMARINFDEHIDFAFCTFNRYLNETDEFLESRYHEVSIYFDNPFVHYDVEECPVEGHEIVNNICRVPPPRCSDHAGLVGPYIYNESSFSSPPDRVCIGNLPDDLFCYADRIAEYGGFSSGLCLADGSCAWYSYKVSSDPCSELTPGQLAGTQGVPSPDPCIDGPDGSMVCYDSATGEITVIDPDGNITELPPGTGAICGIQNGTAGCVLLVPDDSGCGYFNGEYVCYDDDGEEIDPGDPDHPGNGGNGNGDSTDDPLDPNDDGSGGGDDGGSGGGGNLDQIVSDRINTGKIIDAIGDQTDAIQGSLDGLQGGIVGGITEQVDDPGLSFSEGVSAIEGQIGSIDQTFDDQVTALSDVEQGDGLLNGSSGKLEQSGGLLRSMFAFSGHCSDFSIPFGDLGTYELRCADFESVRFGLTVFFWGLIAIYGFKTVTGAIKEVG